jgi:hypothetical protein
MVRTRQARLPAFLTDMSCEPGDWADVVLPDQPRQDLIHTAELLSAKNAASLDKAAACAAFREAATS